jgi:thiamine-monophosphate kinase
MASRKTPLSQIPRNLQGPLAPHLYPQPRIAQGLYLQRRRLATAAIDLSDGLSTDLDHLCAESGVSAEIDAAAIPIHPGATLDQALNGGEDYELLFCAPSTSRIPRAIAGVPITRIGRILRTRRSRSPVTLVTATGAQPLEPRGWQHFS